MAYTTKLHLGLTISVLAICSLSAQLEDIYLNDITEHRKACSRDIATDPLKKKASYPMSRVQLTISADDADAIPKVANAGKIYQEDSISYQVMHNGIKVVKDGYYAPWVTDTIYALKGHHEPQEEKVFHEVLKYIPEKATMIELGAYWGYYSLWFSQQIKGAKNYLVEPNEKNIQIGKTNFKLNGKKASFYQGFVKANPNDTFTGAAEILIDSFLKKEGIKHVNILHSDIQGAEYAMLKSCKRAVQASMIDFFFISTHGPEVHENCLKFLKKAKYIIISEHTMAESCSYDGLIVARRKNVRGPAHVHVNKYAP